MCHGVGGEWIVGEMGWWEMSMREITWFEFSRIERIAILLGSTLRNPYSGILSRSQLSRLVYDRYLGYKYY